MTMFWNAENAFCAFLPPSLSRQKMVVSRQHSWPGDFQNPPLLSEKFSFPDSKHLSFFCPPRHDWKGGLRLTAPLSWYQDGTSVDSLPPFQGQVHLIRHAIWDTLLSSLIQPFQQILAAIQPDHIHTGVFCLCCGYLVRLPCYDVRIQRVSRPAKKELQQKVV